MNDERRNAQQAGPLAALESPRCRVRVLGLNSCAVGGAFAESVARLVATGALAATGGGATTHEGSYMYMYVCARQPARPPRGGVAHAW